jgi:hypothetical protein
VSELAAPLVIHRERSALPVTDRKAVDGRETVCERPTPRFLWLFPDGTFCPVRCKATNKCAGCAMIQAFENALVVRLDALDGERFPTWGLTTTTRTPNFDQVALRRCEENLYRALRREYGRQIEYLGFVEFTTGRATAGRRPHVHHLVKGLPRPSADMALELEGRVSELWFKYTREAWVVECRPLRTPMGSIAYLALHHNKLEQRPPKGWSGKRFRPSRGYFNRPVGELRDEARALLADKRIERALIEAWEVPDGFDSALLDELIYDGIDEAREQALANRPTLQRVTRHGLVPVAPAQTA